MTIFTTFIVTVAAGIVCHIVCKWLDSNDEQQ